jgi:predicted DNA-binding ribbon-helix-helix protein
MKIRAPTKVLMQSLVVKRSVKVDGRTTSVSLEGDFWNALKEIAADQMIPIQELVLKIDSKREGQNLSLPARIAFAQWVRPPESSELRERRRNPIAPRD